MENQVIVLSNFSSTSFMATLVVIITMLLCLYGETKLKIGLAWIKLFIYIATLFYTISVSTVSEFYQSISIFLVGSDIIPLQTIVLTAFGIAVLTCIAEIMFSRRLQFIRQLSIFGIMLILCISLFTSSFIGYGIITQSNYIL